MLAISLALPIGLVGSGDGRACLGAEPDYTPRAYYGAKFEPRGTVLHGAGQDVQGFLDYAELMGAERRPLLYMTYISITLTPEHLREWGERIQREMQPPMSDNAMLQIGLNLTGSNDTGLGRDGKLAEGEFDDNLDDFCKILKELGRPAFVRIGYEFEGSWNGYQPDSFRKAWVRITKAMRKHELQAATVWCSAGASAGDMPLADRMAYYPGDEWVDWWGIDLFNAEEALSPLVADFCSAARDHRKPVMIGEATPRYVGVLDGQQSWDKWFDRFFQLIRKEPGVKAFCYINWEWAEWSDRLGFQWYDWGDCRLEKNSIVTQLYRDEMGSPLYEHDSPTQAEATQP